MPPNLDKLLEMPRAKRYARSKDENVVLPRVYGDFLSSTYVPNDDADGGFLKAELIDTFNRIYLLNDGPVPSSPRPIIYWGDVRQPDDARIYSWFNAIDHEGIGRPISAIQVMVDSTAKEISWRGYGTASVSTGALITNPMDGLVDAFAAYAAWTSPDVDQGSLAQTRADMNTLGDTFHWVFDEERTARETLQAILQHYHTRVFEQASGSVRVMLDRSVTSLPVSVFATVDADTDLLGSARGVSYRGDVANLMNTARLSRRRKWTTREYTDIPVVQHASSVATYGSVYKPFELPGCYSDAETLRWWQGMVAQYAHKPYIVRFTTRSLHLKHALPWTFLGFIWRRQGWTTPRLLKVLNQELRADGLGIEFECFDCQRSISETFVPPTIPIEEVRRRVAEGGVGVDLTPPAPATNLMAFGSYRQIVLTWTPPLDWDYDHTEIWSATVNDRASATPTRNGGYKGTACQETFAVPEGSTWYVWVMTVDESGNGKNGGQQNGGNWYPASATAGVIATASLVPTTGVQTNAITQIYGPDVSLSGTFVGQRQIAHTFLPATEPAGTIDISVHGSVQVESLSTIVVEVREVSPSGALVAQQHLINAFNSVGTFGVHFTVGWFTPTFGIYYIMTFRAIGQALDDRAWTSLSPQLQIRHVKR
jgi:hypothetical protein